MYQGARHCTNHISNSQFKLMAVHRNWDYQMLLTDRLSSVYLEKCQILKATNAFTICMQLRSDLYDGRH